MYNIFNDTCLIALKIKDWSPRILHLKSLHMNGLESLRTLDLEIFIRQLQNEFF
jgi:hypothetical protein